MGLVDPMACGILVSQPGFELASPALEGRFLTTGPPGKSPISPVNPTEISVDFSLEKESFGQEPSTLLQEVQPEEALLRFV